MSCTNNTSNINKTFIIGGGGVSGDTYVVAGSFSADTLTLTRNDLVDIIVTGFTSGSFDNFYTTGVTIDNNIAYFDRNDSLSAYTLDLTPYLDNTDTFTTGGTLVSGTTLVFDRNDILSAFTIDLSGLVTTGTTGDTKLIPLIYEPNGGTANIIPALGTNGVNTSTKYGTITGGRFNSVTGIADYSVIWGGKYNLMAGSKYSVLGGLNNIHTGSDFSTVFGGRDNTAQSSDYTTIGGGFDNSATFSNFTTIMGGKVNVTLRSEYSVLGGGSGNTITYYSNGSSIIGGFDNMISGLTNVHVIGSNITAVSANTTHVNNLNLYDIPVSSTSLTQILVRDSNGMIRVRDYSSFDSANDTFISGTSFDSNTYILSIDRNDGVSFTENLSALASDVYVLSGVYVPETGIVTYTNSTGGTFQVSGFTTGMTDSYTTDASLSGESITFDNNIQGSNLYNVSLTPLLSGKTDLSLFNSHTGDTSIHHTISELDDLYVNVTGDTMTGPLIINSTLNVTGDTTLAAVSGDTYFVQDYIQFNTGYTGNTVVEGRLYWDENDQTLALGMHSGEVLQQIGQEVYYLIKNQSGATIENGKVVRAAGTLGSSGRILGEYMIADGTMPPKFTLGVATHDIINGEDGYVTEFGFVRGLDTTGAPYGETWNDGDILWVSPTVAGGLTNIEPTTPNLHIEIAIVINAAANGTIFVRPHRYPNSHDIQDFGWSAGTENNLDVIQYNSSLGYFELTNSPLFNSISANTISGGTYYGDGSNLTGIAGGSDTYITGSTITGDTTLVLTNNSGDTVTQDLEIERELSFRAEEFALNTANRVTLTPMVISTVRFAGSGPIDDAGLSFIIPNDYKSGGDLSYTFRTSSSNTSLTGTMFFDIYTGDTGNTGTIITATETVQIDDTPESTANVFIFSPSVTPTTQFAPNMQIHLRVYRNPAVDDNFDIDLINLRFRYNAKR